MATNKRITSDLMRSARENIRKAGAALTARKCDMALDYLGRAQMWVGAAGVVPYVGPGEMPTTAEERQFNRFLKTVDTIEAGIKKRCFR